MEEEFTGNLGYNGLESSFNYFTFPPDVSTIANSELVVIFKSLAKKDSKTKEKALNELLVYIGEHDNQNYFDDSAIICWVKQYPKIAIDNEKSVRLLAHQVQGAFLKGLGKAYSRFLKSTMPIWLMGIYDQDKSVSSGAYKSLLDSFSGDASKVEKTWQVFQEPLVNLIGSVVTVESPETLADARYTSESDMQIKYDRVLSASILLLLKVLSGKPSSVDAILQSDTMWKKLSSSASGESMNLSLFRTILTLIAKLFTISSDKTSSDIDSVAVDSIADLNSVYKKVCKAILKVKFGADVQSIVYSTVIISFWHALFILTRYGFEHKTKKNLWEIGSKASSRLQDYIELGPCDSDPSYYTLIIRLFTDMKKYEIKIIEDLGTTCVKSLLHPYNRLRDTFKPVCLDAALQLIEVFGISNTSLVKEIANNAVLGLSNAKRENTRIEFTSIFKNHGDLLTEAIKSIAGDVTHQILHLNLNSNTNGNENANGSEMAVPPLETPTSLIIALLTVCNILNLNQVSNELVDAVVANNKIQQSKVSTIVTAYVETNENVTPAVEQYISKISEIIGQDASENSIYLLKATQQSQNLNNESQMTDLINESFNQLTLCQPQLRNNFIRIMNVDMDKDSYPRIYEYVKENTAERIDNKYVDRIFELGDEEILQNLIKDLNESSMSLFLTSASKQEYLDRIINLKINNVLHSAWTNLSKPFLQSLSKYGDVYFESLLNFIRDNSLQTNWKKLVDLVETSPFLYDRFEQELRKSINKLSVNEVSISNALGSAIYISKHGSASLEKELVSLARFVVILYQQRENTQEQDSVGENSRKWRKLSLIASEYISDYLFTQSLDFKDENALFETLKLRPDFQISLCELAEKFVTIEEGMANDLDLFEFYYARSLAKAIENACENANLTAFESLNINYQKLVKQPFKFVALVTGTRRFLSSSSFDRVRNYVFSEILSVRAEEDILQNGLKWMSLLLPLQDYGYKGDLYAGVKLNMVLGKLQSWLDSSISYDEDFIDMRIQMMRFLSQLPSIQQTLPDAYDEITMRLIEENFEMANDRIDLKYYTLKSYLALTRTNVSLDVPNETLMSLLLTSSESKKTQVQNLVEGVLERVILSVKFGTKKLLEHKDSLFKLLLNSQSTIIIRLAAFYLSIVLESEKDDFVIEYQLSENGDKDKESDDNSIKKLKPTLPAPLMQVANKFSVESELESLRFLLSWLLISNYLNNVTISIRNAYLNELLSSKNFQTILFYIFDHIEMSTQFLDSLTKDSITTNDVVGIHKTEPIDTELKLLALQVYFRLLKHSGFQVQLWFQEIRDKQLQAKVQKVTTKHLSPFLINEILEKVAAEKDSIQSKQDNLTIKVNLVASEVKTMYIVDDQRLEMVIKIPKSYPLENVSIDGPSRVGVKENRWKAWLLASQKIISIQNGSVVDAIELFCKNINLHFSGFEDCAICYSILHQDMSLPSKTCQTCNNKFHAACLYKWFKSSGNSTCPLCRSGFNFKSRN
ncbi:hypothetical protein PVL30_000047 [Lodderomyces elongisporus]|uniref:uncharacterized protein n=1 Tax=Lodderomyces elongisporus TaxID=36914 RepID=UPI00291F653A|nr:uncharacterized protein PVL30_000047 [Lodderomyces elongisporus]WLF76346.1 hypothetical protein PVL30_000047 [Lodderomyces elongisporus]